MINWIKINEKYLGIFGFGKFKLDYNIIPNVPKNLVYHVNPVNKA